VLPRWSLSQPLAADRANGSFCRQVTSPTTPGPLLLADATTRRRLRVTAVRVRVKPAAARYRSPTPRPTRSSVGLHAFWRSGQRPVRHQTDRGQ
jgi:hypothetical protein